MGGKFKNSKNCLQENLSKSVDSVSAEFEVCSAKILAEVAFLFNEFIQKINVANFHPTIVSLMICMSNLSNWMPSEIEY